MYTLTIKRITLESFNVPQHPRMSAKKVVMAETRRAMVGRDE